MLRVFISILKRSSFSDIID